VISSLGDSDRFPLCPGDDSCTSYVRVPVFLVQCGILDHLKLCNLHILRELFLLWFESMPELTGTACVSTRRFSDSVFAGLFFAVVTQGQ
jgi:hypothetical protein